MDETNNTETWDDWSDFDFGDEPAYTDSDGNELTAEEFYNSTDEDSPNTLESATGADLTGDIVWSADDEADTNDKSAKTETERVTNKDMDLSYLDTAIKNADKATEEKANTNANSGIQALSVDQNKVNDVVAMLQSQAEKADQYAYTRNDIDAYKAAMDKANEAKDVSNNKADEAYKAYEKAAEDFGKNKGDTEAGNKLDAATEAYNKAHDEFQSDFDKAWAAEKTYESAKEDVDKNGYTETSGITKAEEEARKAAATDNDDEQPETTETKAEETKETEEEEPKTEENEETPVTTPAVEEPENEEDENEEDTETKSEEGEIPSWAINDPVTFSIAQEAAKAMGKDFGEEDYKAIASVMSNNPNLITFMEKALNTGDKMAILNVWDACKEFQKGNYLSGAWEIAKATGQGIVGILQHVVAGSYNLLTLAKAGIQTMRASGKRPSDISEKDWNTLQEIMDKEGSEAFDDEPGSSERNEVDLNKMNKNGFSGKNTSATNYAGYNKGISKQSVSDEDKKNFRQVVKSAPHVRLAVSKW